MEILQKRFPAVGMQASQHVVLQRHRDLSRLLVFAPADREQLDPMGASILLVGFTPDIPVGFHSFQQGRHGIRVAGHRAGEFALGNALGIPFDEGAHDRELIRGDAGVGDSPAERLIQSVPRAPKQDGESAATRSVDGLTPGAAGGWMALEQGGAPG